MKTNPNLLRLRLPLIGLVLFWIVSLVVRAVDKPYFVGFFYGLASTGLITLLILGWWWFNRQLLWREKLLGFVFVLGEAFIVGKLSHPSINGFTLWMTGFPLIATFTIAGLFLIKRIKTRMPWLSLAVVVSLTWGYFALIRVDGLDSRLQAKTHWRWTPTPEEKFLAETKAVPASGKLTNANTAIIADSSRGDWTSFRGEERDGVIRGTAIATNWNGASVLSVWKHGVGPAWSSLLVVGNRLYTQEQRGENETVVGYDADSGEQVWAHEDIGRFNETVSGPGPRATPTFANGRLYTLGGTGLLNCLDAATGACLWKMDIKDASGAKAAMWGFVSSPLVAGDLVVVYAGGEAGKGLLAYRAESGALAWTAPAGASSYSSPQLTSIAGVPQCLMLHDAGLTAVDIATGRVLWETGVAMKGAPRTGQPRLMEANKLLVASLGGLGCSLIEVSKNGDKWIVTEKWATKSLKPEFPDFVAHKGYAYGFDVGIFCCINLTDGNRRWKEGRYGRGQVMLLADQDVLLVSTETGELVLLAADASGHRQLGRFQAIEGKTWNHPVVRGNRIYLRNAQEMACYSVSAKASGLADFH
jgi:outer membrane protein assembly factor BamB